MYPRKMWFLYGMEGGEWWEWEGVASTVNCTKEEMKRFLHRAITVVPIFDGEMRRGQPKGEEVCTCMHVHTRFQCAFVCVLVRVHLHICVYVS